jgi:hypothetical protein
MWLETWYKWVEDPGGKTGWQVPGTRLPNGFLWMITIIPQLFYFWEILSLFIEIKLKKLWRDLINLIFKDYLLNKNIKVIIFQYFYT